MYNNNLSPSVCACVHIQNSAYTVRSAKLDDDNKSYTDGGKSQNVSRAHSGVKVAARPAWTRACACVKR